MFYRCKSNVICFLHQRDLGGRFDDAARYSYSVAACIIPVRGFFPYAIRYKEPDTFFNTHIAENDAGSMVWALADSSEG